MSTEAQDDPRHEWVARRNAINAQNEPEWAKPKDYPQRLDALETPLEKTGAQVVLSCINFFAGEPMDDVGITRIVDRVCQSLEAHKASRDIVDLHMRIQAYAATGNFIYDREGNAGIGITANVVHGPDLDKQHLSITVNTLGPQVIIERSTL